MVEAQKEILKSFENPSKKRDYLIDIEVPEFTCLCPITGQPDFAIMDIKYVPNQYCIELKSLKLYIGSFRDSSCFHEAVSNKILDDLVNCINPSFIKLVAKFNVRGGTYPTVTCVHKDENWNPRAEAPLLGL
tara:strand:- start:24 stop:419 length:396 start_codon:yes stop_codon:yes gene_type:complete